MPLPVICPASLMPFPLSQNASRIRRNQVIEILHRPVAEHCRMANISTGARLARYLAGLIDSMSRMVLPPGSVPKACIVPLLKRNAWE